MKPETFDVQATGAGGDLPAEWQTVIASQASTLAALLARMQTTAALMHQREAPAAQVQPLAAEAERVLTAQAQGQVRLERELEALRTLIMHLRTRPVDLVARVRTFENAIEL